MDSQQADPFANADDKKDTKEDEKDDDKMDEDKPVAPSGTAGTEDKEGDNAAGYAAPTSVTGKNSVGKQPTEAGAREQAATTAPEGTEAAEAQRAGGNVETDRQIDEGANKKPRTE